MCLITITVQEKNERLALSSSTRTSSYHQTSIWSLSCSAESSQHWSGGINLGFTGNSKIISVSLEDRCGLDWTSVNHFEPETYVTGKESLSLSVPLSVCVCKLPCLCANKRQARQADLFLDSLLWSPAEYFMSHSDFSVVTSLLHLTTHTRTHTRKIYGHTFMAIPFFPS